MAKTPKLGLSYLASAQSQPEVPVNENNVILDVIVAGGIKDRDLTAPPGGESDGDAYIPSATATGAWAGLENHVVVWADPDGTGGAWIDVTPTEGMTLYCQDEKQALRFDGFAWQRALDMTIATEFQDDTPVIQQVQRTTSHAGHGANGIGVQYLIQIENDDGALKNALAVIDQLADATDGNEKGQRIYQVNINGLMTDVLQISYQGTKVGDGAWNGQHLLMGAYHLWIDATGDLRIKNGAPASDVDGTVVGTQS